MSSESWPEAGAPQGRRGFLRLLGALAAALAAPGIVRSRPPAGDGVALARELLACLRATADARAIGQAYLRVAPAERDRGALAARLTGVVRGAGVDARAPRRGELRRALQARIRADFASGRTVRVEGWVLAETEARLCALAVLVAA